MDRCRRPTTPQLLSKTRFLRGRAEKKRSAAKDGGALDARRRKRFNTHDYYEADPSDRRSLCIMNQTERRLHNRNPQARGCLSRLKCGNGSMDCGIRPVHCWEEENDRNAENDEDSQNS